MATQPTPSPVGPSHLRSCTDVANVVNLFRLLHYPVPRALAAVPITSAELRGELRDAISERCSLATITDRQGTTLGVTLFVLSSVVDRAATIRAVAQAWTRAIGGHHLLVFACPGNRPGEVTNQFAQIVLVNPRRLTEGTHLRIKLHKLLIDRAHPTRHDVETINALAILTQGISPDKLFQQQCDAFNVEQITKKFYTEYAIYFDRVRKRIKDDNPALPLVHDPIKLHSFTQRLFGRVMFLYFLQKKGALNQDPDFVTKWCDHAMKTNRNYYRTILEELFFNTLNRERDGNQHPIFGTIPYLNGGLFAADDEDYVGIIYLDNAIFDPNSETGLLHFLNNHNFTVSEDTPLEIEVALDPEMLGKVFENLLAVEERGQSGTFYTPRSVVAFMCRQALAAYLAKATGVSPERLSWLLDEAETGEPAFDAQGNPLLNERTLATAQRKAIDDALLQVRILDPAVGSGAFPLGMLALLVGVRRALYRITQVTVSLQSIRVDEWKRIFIKDCLYGVDIRREAIDIARLRLWLSLVVDADPFKMDPLPNLDYKLMDGDSLIETFHGVEIMPTRPKQGNQQATLDGMDPNAELIATLGKLRDGYFQPGNAEERKSVRALKAQIDVTKQTLVEQIFQQRDAWLTGKLNEIIRKRGLVPGKTEQDALSKEEAKFLREIEVHQEVLQAYRQKQALPFFLYRLEFGNIFQDHDGFDIVIANPPYVSIENMKPETKESLRSTYTDVAASRGDLYTYFYARALQLLRSNGTFAFITSNKFFRSGYGKGLLQVLKDRTAIHTVIDFGDTPVFDAAAYPCIVVADNTPPSADHRYSGFTTPPEFQYADLDNLAETFADEHQELDQSKGVRPPASINAELIDKLLTLGTPLGKYANGKIFYGIKTGRNEAFIVDQVTHDRFIAANPVNAEVLKPFFRGRDISRYSATHTGYWLIYAYHGIDIKRYPAIEQYLLPYRIKLESRATQQPWYELQQPQQAYQSAFELPKIAYPELAQSAGFVYDDTGTYIDCTLFCLPNQPKYFVSLLNSKLLDCVLLQISPAVRGDFHRYKRAYIERLPIIEPSSADQQRLTAIVDELQTLRGQGPRAEALEREVDAIVYKTYGLTSAEIAEIETWHADRRQQLSAPRNRSRQPRREDLADDELVTLEAPVIIPSTQDDQLPEKIDVAISFAGTERDLARALAERVGAAGFKPFYDEYYPHLTWGADLSILFDDIYRKRSRYCVMFISQEYLARPWTSHERQSAIARAIQEHGQNYILPIMVNETLEIPGIASGIIGHLSLQQMSIDDIADVLIRKLQG